MCWFKNRKYMLKYQIYFILKKWNLFTFCFVLVHSPLQVPGCVQQAEHLLLSYMLNPFLIFLFKVWPLLYYSYSWLDLEAPSEDSLHLLAICSCSFSSGPSFSSGICCSLLIFLSALFLQIDMSPFVRWTRGARVFWSCASYILCLRDFWQHSRGYHLDGSLKRCWILPTLWGPTAKVQ